MIPRNLASSYERYKKDTNTFVAWLHANALSCGYTPPGTATNAPLGNKNLNSAQPASSNAGRLKGKARKDAAKAASASKSEPTSSSPDECKVIPTVQLLKQAQAVAASKKVKVPIIIQRLLQEAIKARKRCTFWFTNVLAKDERKLEDIDRNNNSHEYFIKVLEMTYDILKPRFEMPKARMPKTRSESVADGTGKGTSEEDPTNRFESLEVEDIDQSAYDALPSAIPRSKSATNVELEIDADADLPFVVFCFYEDMHRFRHFLVDTWRQVRDEKLSYMTASLITNIAIELIRKEEDALVASFPSLGEPSYVAITSKICPVRMFGQVPESSFEQLGETLAAMRKVRDNLSQEQKEEPEKDSPSNPPKDDISEADLKTASVDMFLFTSTFHTLEKCRTMIKIHRRAYIPAVPPLEAVYLWAPDSRVDTPNWQIEDAVLSKFMVEVEVKIFSEIPEEQAQKARKAGLLEPLPSESFVANPILDKFTEELQEACNDRSKPVSMCQVFVARTLLDILMIIKVQKAREVYLDLRQRGANTHAALEITWTKDEDIQKTRSGCVQTREELVDKWIRPDAVAAAVSLSHNLNIVVKQPSLVSFKQNVLEKLVKDNFNQSPEEADTVAEKPDTLTEERASLIKEGAALLKELNLHNFENILPSGDPMFFFICLPVYSGLEALKMIVDLDHIGPDLANDFCSLMPMAHLYNCLQQQGLLPGRWDLMDRFIETNMSKLFSGSLPDTIMKCFKRLFICMGLPAESFAKGGRRHKRPNFLAALKKVEHLLEPHKVSSSLKRYFDGSDSGEKLLFDILKQPGHSHTRQKSSADRLQLLAHLRDRIEESIPNLDINMIGLVRQCNKLFQRLREDFKLRLLIEHQAEGRDYANYFQPWNIMTAMDIIGEMGEMEDAGATFRSPGVGSQTGFTIGDDEENRLSITLKILRDFMLVANIVPKLEPFDVIASTKMAKEDMERDLSEREWKKWHRAMMVGLNSR
ncbi:hypothetical protein BDZ45DRAFT_697996 [Acephala macrosclerotiorum]|nr:hypothetical protein BDZ45DRAFT_697996 [Acephala macrosclerotiorum]